MMTSFVLLLLLLLPPPFFFFFNIFSAQALERPCPQFCSEHTEVQNPATCGQVTHMDGGWLVWSVLCALPRAAEAGGSTDAGGSAEAA